MPQGSAVALPLPFLLSCRRDLLSLCPCTSCCHPAGICCRFALALLVIIPQGSAVAFALALLVVIPQGSAVAFAFALPLLLLLLLLLGLT
jgi:hypothetical protein